MVASEAAAQRSQELAEMGMQKAVQGVEELAAGAEITDTARQMAGIGVGMAVAGAAEVGGATAGEAVIKELGKQP